MIKILDKNPKPKGLYDLKLSTLEDPIELHQDTLIQFGLFSQNTIESDKLEAILSYDKIARAMQDAIKKLSYRNYTPKRMHEQLSMLNYNKETIEEAVRRLKELNYINEKQSLELIVEDFLQFDLKGKNHLNFMLIDEGFDQETIDNIMHLYTDELELEKCSQLLEQLHKSLKKTSIKQSKLKLTQKLYQKGFTEETILKAINDFEATLSDIDEHEVLEDLINKYQSKYDLSNPKEKQKLMQKLMREGFKHSDIKNHLE